MVASGQSLDARGNRLDGAGSRARRPPARRDYERRCAASQGAPASAGSESVNNALTVLNTLLKKAVEWGVPMAAQLEEALRAGRHLRGELVLYREDNAPFTEAAVQAAVDRAAREAGLRGKGPHMLRHTFCSHLAMNGAQLQVIQAWAGHQSVLTTQRYMHLSPAVQQEAIRLLEQRPSHARGDIKETAAAAG
jgi:integrase